METLLNARTELTDAALAAIAHMPTASLPALMDEDFARRLTDASGTESLLRCKGVQVEILEDPRGIELYARFRAERPELDLEDWQGCSATGKQ